MNEQEYSQYLAVQHMRAVEEVLVSYMVFCPELITPRITVPDMIRTIVQLNDGRECDVSTSSQTGLTLQSWTK